MRTAIAHQQIFGLLADVAVFRRNLLIQCEFPPSCLSQDAIDLDVCGTGVALFPKCILPHVKIGVLAECSNITT